MCSNPPETSVTNDEKYWLWLCSGPFVSWATRKSLLDYFGSPGEILHAPEKEFDIWKRTFGKWVHQLCHMRNEETVEEIAADLKSKNISFVSCKNSAFPEMLKQIPDPPMGLFYRGSLPSPSERTAAVVGARACSEAGRTMAVQIGRILAENGVSVISGMAAGIDGSSQAAALEAGGRSYGVLGCGVDICYPRDNWNLYHRLWKEGGLISEYSCQTPPLRQYFPMRNRIISGLAQTVVVVEAREKSGSLITADTALEQGRDVLAVPGRWSDPLSKGCNQLIDQGAGILLGPGDLLQKLGISSGAKAAAAPREPKDPLLLKVWNAVTMEPLSITQICTKTALTAGEASASLVRLALEGYVRECGNHYYVRSQVTLP